MIQTICPQKVQIIGYHQQDLGIGYIYILVGSPGSPMLQAGYKICDGDE